MVTEKRKKLLKGNFEVEQPVERNVAPETATEVFEKEALKKLGGSIAYVKKKKFIFDPEAKKT